MTLTITQIADRVGGEVVGDASTQITGFSPADAARNGDLTFADKEAYFAVADQSKAL